MAAPTTETPVEETAAPVKAPDLEPVPESAAPAKAEKSKKEKKGTKDAKAPAGVEEATPSIAAHPRAVRAVARAKSWGGLAGFLLAGYLSLPTATPLEAGLRALAAGLICYVVAWGGAVFAWRRLVMIEIRAREAQLVAAAKARPALAAGEQGGARAGARG